MPCASWSNSSCLTELLLEVRNPVAQARIGIGLAAQRAAANSSATRASSTWVPYRSSLSEPLPLGVGDPDDPTARCGQRFDAAV